MSEGQRQALQRLADYPARVERLKQLWIDVQGGGRGAPSRLARAGASTVFSRSGSLPPRSDPCAGQSRGGCQGGPGGQAWAGTGAQVGRAASVPVAGIPLSARQIRDIMTRDLTPEDYELLLLLDQGVIKRVPRLAAGCGGRLPRAEMPPGGWAGEACTVCLGPAEVGDDLRMLPACGHLFHAACIEQWLTASKASCPLCGREVSRPPTPPLAGAGPLGSRPTSPTAAAEAFSAAGAAAGGKAEAAPAATWASALG